MTVQYLDSITDISDCCTGQVVVTGSHGGMYAAYCASRVRLRGAIFNDAGIGLDKAGVAGVLALADTGLAAVAVAHTSCRIGQAREAHAFGIVSVANELAKTLGVHEGMTCAEAESILGSAPLSQRSLPAVVEAREHILLDSAYPTEEIRLLDSASLVSADDEGAIVITGSHGGLIGDDPKRALKAAARIAVFNDAGVGRENAGITRLPVLEEREIAALTVAHTSARIGDARNMLERGNISHVNNSARKLGAAPGLGLRTWLSRVLQQKNSPGS